MSIVPWKDLKYSRFYVRSVYCSWKKLAKLFEQATPVFANVLCPVPYTRKLQSRRHSAIKDMKKIVVTRYYIFSERGLATGSSSGCPALSRYCDGF